LRKGFLDVNRTLNTFNEVFDKRIDASFKINEFREDLITLIETFLYYLSKQSLPVLNVNTGQDKMNTLRRAIATDLQLLSIKKHKVETCFDIIVF
jgi:hypothetical protein